MESRLSNLYLLNAAILFTHEIDSAFWKEWDLFGIPGGIQLFLVVNFVLIVVFLHGFRQLHRGLRSGLIYSLVLAGSGIFAFAIHGFFIATGHPEFTLPVSIGILVLAFPVSVIQGIVSLKALSQHN